MLPGNFLFLPLVTSAASSKSSLTVCQEIQFANEECFCHEIIGMNGTCWSSSECQIYRGVPCGSCAGGYGTCCVLIVNGT